MAASQSQSGREALGGDGGAVAPGVSSSVCPPSCNPSRPPLQLLAVDDEAEPAPRVAGRRWWDRGRRGSATPACTCCPAAASGRRRSASRASAPLRTTAGRPPAAHLDEQFFTFTGIAFRLTNLSGLVPCPCASAPAKHETYVCDTALGTEARTNSSALNILGQPRYRPRLAAAGRSRRAAASAESPRGVKMLTAWRGFHPPAPSLADPGRAQPRRGHHPRTEAATAAASTRLDAGAVAARVRSLHLQQRARRARRLCLLRGNRHRRGQAPAKRVVAARWVHPGVVDGNGGEPDEERQS